MIWPAVKGEMRFHLPNGCTMFCTVERLKDLAKGRTKREVYEHLGLPQYGYNFATFSEKISKHGLGHHFVPSKTGRKPAPREPEHIVLVRTRVRCLHRNCSGIAFVQHERGTKAPPKRCERCEKRGGPPEETIPSVRVPKPQPSKVDKGRVLKPGDPGFAGIAAQITPPSRIGDHYQKGVFF